MNALTLIPPLKTSCSPFFDQSIPSFHLTILPDFYYLKTYCLLKNRSFLPSAFFFSMRLQVPLLLFSEICRFCLALPSHVPFPLFLLYVSVFLSIKHRLLRKPTGPLQSGNNVFPEAPNATTLLSGNPTMVVPSLMAGSKTSGEVLKTPLLSF